MIKFKGKYTVEAVYDDKIIDRFELNNAVTDEGKEYAFQTVFGDGTQYSTWYIGIINGTPTPVLNAGDTLASHGGWAELGVSRVEWAYDISNGTASSTTFAQFILSTASAIGGMFLCNASSGTSGVLWATAATSSVVNYPANTVIRITYSVSL